MSAGDARHGRRDNGLVAAEYVAAGDVDPRVGEHLLDVLALDGIAAYLRPSTDLHPITRSTLLPSRPTDRLYVDRAHLTTARDYLNRLATDAERAEQAEQAERAEQVDLSERTELTERGDSVEENSRTDAPPTVTTAADRATPGAALTGDDVDAEWAKIVAGYDVTADPVRSGGVDLPRSEPPTYHRASYPPATAEPSILDGLDTFGADLPDDDEGTFTPPEPPPMPRPTMPTVLSIVGIIGGLAVFLKPDLLSFIDESLSMFLGFTAIVTGFGTLVWRLRPGDEDDDLDPDDGAKV